MLGVFALSALVGGGAAGIMLALTDQGASERTVASTEGVGIITPMMHREEASGAPATTSGSAGSAVLPKNERATARVTPRSPAPATSAASGALPAGGSAVPGKTTKPTQAAGAITADTAGAAELARLTNQVVAALSAMNGATAEEDGRTMENAVTGAERLRRTLAELVSAAQAQGRSDEEIRRLVAEALDNAGEENIPAILRDASGKVNVQRLLASVMPARRQDVMPKDSEGLAYFRQLEEEAGRTSTEDRPAGALRQRAGARRVSGRFFIVNGKRYTIIRKGDTLSDIAYAAYGDVLAYPAILRANRGRISARRLKPGTRILIPELKRKPRAGRKGIRRRSQAGATAPAIPRKAERKGGAQSGPAASKQKTVIEKIITLPASGTAGTAERTKPVKVTNFRSARDAKPLPITPQAPAK